MILFLDFDGVLHPDPCYDDRTLFCCLPRLESVLRDFPEVQVVITSTWREKRSLPELRTIFSSDISSRIIGMTPVWKNFPALFDTIGYQRQAEVEAWLREIGEPWQSWIAIDDKAYLFRPFLPNLVKTNSLVGLDSDSESALRRKLLVIGK